MSKYKPKYNTDAIMNLLKIVLPNEPAERLKELDSQKIDETVDRVMRTLAYREREILKLRYDLQGMHGRSYAFKEIGEKFLIGPSGAGKAHAKAIKKLKHPIRARKLTNLLYATND